MENSILIIAILLKTLQLLSIAFRLNSNLWTLYILSSTCSLALYLGNYTYLLFSENIIFLWKLYLIPCPKSGLKFPSICFQSVLSIYPITLHFLFICSFLLSIVDDMKAETQRLFPLVFLISVSDRIIPMIMEDRNLVVFFGFSLCLTHLSNESYISCQ